MSHKRQYVCFGWRIIYQKSMEMKSLTRTTWKKNPSMKNFDFRSWIFYSKNPTICKHTSISNPEDKNNPTEQEIEREMEREGETNCDMQNESRIFSKPQVISWRQRACLLFPYRAPTLIYHYKVYIYLLTRFVSPLAFLSLR